jgi:dihydroflavonol-4-reductase
MATTTKKPTTRKAAKSPSLEKSVAIAVKSKPVTLVTGGTGFLGSHLVRALLAKNDRTIRVLTSSLTKLDEVETVEGSITDTETLKKALNGVSEVYHLAGKVSRDEDDAHEMYQLHVEGTRLLCQAATYAGVKSIVLASTSGTVAVTEDGEALPDEDWPQPLEIISRWPYYASKFYQERAALENFNGPEKRLIIMNPSLLLGPGDDRLSSTKVVLDFMARKITSVPSGGLNFVDVRDAATAFVSAMENGRHGERYLLGAANWTFKTFFDRLERLTKIAGPRISLPSKLTVGGSKVISALYRHWNMAPPVEAGAVEMAEHFWYLDHSKAERELGFVARDPAETLNDTVQYIKRNFMGASAFTSSA